MSGMPVQRRRPVVTTVSANKRLLFMLIGVFLILAPASVSGAAADSGVNLKWVRVGVLILMTFVGLRWFRLPNIGELSGKLLLLACVFTLAALWSTAPLWALLLKGMFVCAVCASMSLANCLRTETDFRVLARTLTFSAFAAVVIVAYLIATNDYTIWKGRLVIAQMNANSMGLSAAIFALLCLFHVLIGDRPFWRMLAILLIGVMSVLVVYSGSRAAVLTVAAGGLLLMPAMAGSRRNAIGLALVSVLSLATVSVLWFLASPEQEEATFEAEVQVELDATEEDRLRIIGSLTKDTRLKIWRSVAENWLETNPVLGAGWLHQNNRWRLVQSSYLQVVAESGVLGLVCLVIFFAGAVSVLYRSLHYARNTRGFGSLLLYLFAATFFAVAFHGIFESAMVVGSSPNAILLGFSAAQLDIQLRSAMLRRRRAHQAGRPGPGGRPRPTHPSQTPPGQGVPGRQSPDVMSSQSRRRR